MARLREIPRTAAFAWSPGPATPYLATGTRAGAVDADFSSDTKLELWGLDLGNEVRDVELKPVTSIETDSRFHDIAWVQQKGTQGRGVIAGALENGSLDLWDASKLLSKQSDGLMSRTSKHSGAIKTLQFNPSRSELLATAGAKGELYISDLNNIEDPFRLGNAAGRADDFECLDWNKKVPHIMVTGSSGGFVTVWDVKAKKESLTLNNLGRKPVSAVVWDPTKPTRLITAVPLDTEPLILVWDLRNSNAPEKVLKGHDGGVLSLSWCQQDSDLLLSCGKDNRTLCWNPQSGELYGEFPVVTNWTFQTRWNPHNPGLLATASFDGKISIQTIQNTKAESQRDDHTAPLDGEDFFANPSTQTQASSFSLPKPPKWLERPSAVSFGFGGKIVCVGLAGGEGENRKSAVKVSSFVVDKEISLLAEKFTKTLEQKDLANVCRSRIEDANNANERNDWKTIETLLSTNPRKELIKTLGFEETTQTNSEDVSALTASESESIETSEQSEKKEENRLLGFFDKSDNGDNFLANLASTKGTKANNPYHFYEDSESAVDKEITNALMLGHFDRAMQTCLAEDRLSDAFMIAVCGGQSSIEKVQQAYFKKQASGPKYLRLLASVVGKNLWDIVYNADLENWKEVMATLCTYANADEFSDLCEALGDRLDDDLQKNTTNQELKQSAAFCYIAGSKLEKVMGLWIEDLETWKNEQLSSSEKDTSFAIHARALQNFIEKVTVFREVTKYQDSDQPSSGGWKLAPLYEKYSEYANIVASQGQLDIASKYLDLLPNNYPTADLARNRLRKATREAAPQKATQQAQRPNTVPRGPSVVPGFQSQPSGTSTIPHSNPYAPNQSYYQPNDSQYNSTGYTPAHQPHQVGGRTMIPPPPSTAGLPTAAQGGPTHPPSNPPLSKASNMPNWNDTPEDFFKPPTSRRGTPAVAAQSVSAPFHGTSAGSPVAGLPYSNQGFRQSQAPLPPPPPKGPAPPPRNMTPVSMQSPERPSSAAANTYAPPTASQSMQPQQTPQIPRGSSPYHAPPPPGPPPTSSRYAPTSTPSGTQPIPSATPQRVQPPPNPYVSKSSVASSLLPPPPISGPPKNNQAHNVTAAATSGPPKSATPQHPSGDRSHIPLHALPIFEILSEDMQRVKAKAPATYSAQVNDTEKRLNILFDNLNNETLLKPNTVQDMLELASAIKQKDYERAHSIHLDILTNRTDECGNWMTGVKRLIGMSKATP